MSVKFFRVRSGWDNYVMGDGMGERVGGRRYNRQRVFYLLCSNCLSIGIGSTCDIVVFNPWIWFFIRWVLEESVSEMWNVVNET